MRYNIFIITISVLLLGVSSLDAQVTIGKDIKPEEFSVLQVEYDDTKFTNGAGVQISRLSSEQVVTLGAKINGSTPIEKEKAKGLMVYNTGLKKIVYWNGTGWIPIPSEVLATFTASNGLNHLTAADYTTTVKLGGTLTANTNIPLGGKSLKFTQDNTGEFAIKNSSKTVLTIKNDRVGINTANPTAFLHIKKSDTGGGFRYVDGTQAANKVLTLKDNLGNAEWKDVKSYVSQRGKNYDLFTKTDIRSSTPDVKIGDTIMCTKGKWLIIAKMSSRYSPNQSTDYSWVKVNKMNAAGTTPVSTLAVAGQITEAGGWSVSLPLISFFVTFTEETCIAFYGKPATGAINTIPNPDAYAEIMPWDGSTGFFHAIRLSDRP